MLNVGVFAVAQLNVCANGLRNKNKAAIRAAVRGKTGFKLFI